MRTPSSVSAVAERQLTPRWPTDLVIVPVALYAAYGSNLDPDQMRERCPHSPVQSVGWLRGLAADLRRRGRRLGRRARHGRPGRPTQTYVHALRRLTARREGARRVGGRRRRRAASTRRSGSASRPWTATCWPGPTCWCLRGRPAVVPLPRPDRRSRREGRRASRLRRASCARRPCCRQPARRLSRQPRTGQLRRPSSAAAVSSRTPTPMQRSSTSKPGWCRSYGAAPADAPRAAPSRRARARDTSRNPRRRATAASARRRPLPSAASAAGSARPIAPLIVDHRRDPALVVDVDLRAVGARRSGAASRASTSGTSSQVSRSSTRSVPRAVARLRDGVGGRAGVTCPQTSVTAARGSISRVSAAGRSVSRRPSA